MSVPEWDAPDWEDAIAYECRRRRCRSPCIERKGSEYAEERLCRECADRRKYDLAEVSDE